MKRLEPVASWLLCLLLWSIEVRSVSEAGLFENVLGIRKVLEDAKAYIRKQLPGYELVILAGKPTTCLVCLLACIWSFNILQPLATVGNHSCEGVMALPVLPNNSKSDSTCWLLVCFGGYRVSDYVLSLVSVFRGRRSSLGKRLRKSLPLEQVKGTLSLQSKLRQTFFLVTFFENHGSHTHFFKNVVLRTPETTPEPFIYIYIYIFIYLFIIITHEINYRIATYLISSVQSWPDLIEVCEACHVRCKY